MKKFLIISVIFLFLCFCFYLFLFIFNAGINGTCNYRHIANDTKIQDLIEVEGFKPILLTFFAKYEGFEKPTITLYSDGKEFKSFKIDNCKNYDIKMLSIISKDIDFKVECSQDAKIDCRFVSGSGYFD